MGLPPGCFPDWAALEEQCEKGNGESACRTRIRRLYFERLRAFTQGRVRALSAEGAEACRLPDPKGRSRPGELAHPFVAVDADERRHALEHLIRVEQYDDHNRREVPDECGEVRQRQHDEPDADDIDDHDEFCIAATADDAAVDGHLVRPVSYTHLDVYKRQLSVHTVDIAIGFVDRNVFTDGKTSQCL